MTDTAPTSMMEEAKADLSTNMVPTPEDVLGDVGPVGQLYYAERLLYVVYGMFAGLLANDAVEQPDDDSPPVKALAAIGMACGNLDAACIVMGILPPEAAFDDNRPT